MLRLVNDSTKSRVLHILRGQGGGTAQDVADVLEVSVPAVRRHLMNLEADGLLESQVHRPGGRGRPQHVFRVSGKGESHFPKNYAELCGDILEHIQSLYGAGAVLSVLSERNRKLLELWQPRIDGDLEGRLNALYTAHLEPRCPRSSNAPKPLRQPLTNCSDPKPVCPERHRDFSFSLVADFFVHSSC